MRETAVVKGSSSFSTKAIVAFAFLLIGILPVPLLDAQTLSPVQLEKVVVAGTHPLDASVVDLAGRGYEENEYFVTGVANRFRIPDPLETAKLIDSGHPYKTRIVVRRPLAPRRFNGTVIVEWYNVSAGQDIDFCWGASHDYLMKEGYVWVGVSAQRVGIKQLNAWSPTRYASLSAEASNDDPQGGTLDDRGDVLSWDIFGQVGAAMLKRSKGVDPLAGLQVKRLVAAGESQSALRLTAYYNSIQPLHHVYQGFVYYDAAGALRTDLKVPAISVGTEFGASLPVIASTSSALYLRRWPVAGTSHVSFQEMDSYVDVETLRDGFLKSPDGKAVSVTQGTVGCKQYPIWSKIPTELVLNAAYYHLERWIDGRAPAPTAPQFERNTDGSLKRDEKGDLLGGIRLPQVEVPTGYSSGFNSGPGTCMLSGFHYDYTSADLKDRYHTHAEYVQRVDSVTQELLKSGFILPYDAEQIKTLATVSEVAK